MKLREAANILGVSLDDLTVDGLKLTYRKLLLAWDPEKCKDLSAKQKYMLITEAYKKINTILEGKDSFRNDEQHELAAFMRMFMDMVGISENESLSTAAMTFGMMFGSRPSSIDEWSTDEENEYEDEDEDNDEEEEDEEDDDEEEEDDGNYEGDDGEDEFPAQTEYSVNWEPQAKLYSNMNLKEEIRRAKARGGVSGGVEVEGEKKSKTAKKRAEKRKRQKKDRRQKEKSLSFDEPNDYEDEEEEGDEEEEEEQEQDHGRGGAGGSGSGNNNRMRNQNNTTTGTTTTTGNETPIHRFQLTSDNIDAVIQQNVQRLRERLFQSIALGKAAEAARLLSFHFANAKEVPEPLLQALFASWKKELESCHLLHRCITEKRILLAEYPNDYAKIMQVNLQRVRIAGMILSSNELTLDYNATDDSGLSILHKSIIVEDNDYVNLIIQFILSTTNSNSNRKINLNLNSRCHKKGWAPIHYAVERKNRVALKLLAEAGANLTVTAATDKKLTPMELAKMKLKATQGNDIKSKTDYQLICEEITELLTNQKKEKQKKSIVVSTITTANASDITADAVAMNVEDSNNLVSDDSPALLDPISSSTTTVTAAEKKKKKKRGNHTSAATTAMDVISTPTTPIRSPPPPPPSTTATVASSSSTMKAEKTIEKTEKKSSSSSSTTTAAVTVPNTPKGKQKALSSTTINTTATSAAATVVTPAAVITPSTNKKQKNNQSSTTTTTASSSKANSKSNSTTNTNTTSAMATISVATRDEMVDHLLAMGFKEVDCLAAISLYGTDIDKALSWLCERPATTTVNSAETIATATTISVPATATAAAVTGNSPATPSNSHKHTPITPVKQSHSSSSSSSNNADHTTSVSAAAVPQTPPSATTAEANKTKEELRRINREWNARAEDEKRKAAAAAAIATSTTTTGMTTTAAPHDSQSGSATASSSSQRRHQANHAHHNGNGNGMKGYKILSHQHPQQPLQQQVNQIPLTSTSASTATATASSSASSSSSSMASILSSGGGMLGGNAAGILGNSSSSNLVGGNVGAGVIGRLPSTLTGSSPSLLGLSGGLDNNMPSLTGMDGFDAGYIPIAPTLATSGTSSTSPWTTVGSSGGYSSSYYGDLFGLNGLSSSGSGGLGGTELMDMSSLLAGAAELSAEAKPFIPKTFTNVTDGTNSVPIVSTAVAVSTNTPSPPMSTNNVLRDAAATPLTLPPSSSSSSSSSSSAAATLTATPTPTSLSAMLGSDSSVLPVFTLPSASGNTGSGLDGVSSNVFGSSLWNNPLSLSSGHGGSINLGLGSYVTSMLSTDSFHQRSSFTTEGSSSEYLSSILQGNDYLDGNEFDFDSANTVMPAVLDSLFDGSDMK